MLKRLWASGPLAAGFVMIGLAGGAIADAAAVEDAMRRNPERFSQMVGDLIAGFGSTKGLEPAGIEEHIALERAAARASAMRRYLALDLDGDGTISRDELAVSQRAANASARGKLERQFASADANGDARVDPAELAMVGQMAAMKALDEVEAGVLRSLMRLDGDSDGALQQDELEAALQLLDQAT